MRHRSDQGVLYDLFQRHPEFQECSTQKGALDVLEGVIGKDIFMYENCLVYKPKGKNNAVPWHQDFINRPNEPVKYISWVAMDDVTIDNGAMKLIPGFAPQGIFTDVSRKGETHHDRIKPEYIEEDKAQYVTMQAGDALLFNQLVVHSSDLVNSTKPRRAFRASYQSFEQR
ncbi:MAG: phytanoyl-CoA dioxygenase family protein [Sphingobacteriales bacterium]|nr:phytanoyl-CoA dioxygenase family protein [Sphingobacteriales bacterium]